MNGPSFVKPRWRVARMALGSLLAVGAANAVGCLDRPVEPIEPRTTSTIIDRLTQSAVDKIDLLLAIDNSRSMADKQAILQLAIPDLVSGLVNPKCVDPTGVPAAANLQPISPTDPCPTGFKRDFNPVTDIHIGIVTSSLGGQGADSCPRMDSSPSNGCPNGVNLTEDDRGRLVYRADPCNGNMLQTYDPAALPPNGEGFLAWDPNQKKNPPGEKNVGKFDPATGMTVIPGIVPDLRAMVAGLGQIGCGFEQQNEGWYRFLVDPTPYETIATQVVMVGKPPQAITEAVPNGIDMTLTAQRADFLRSNSLLAIIVLTDENDNSIKDGGQYFLVAQNSGPSADGRTHLAPGTKICETKPSDPCCVNCDQGAPMGCPSNAMDPNCSAANRQTFANNDPINLRETNVKARFGLEFYQQPDRYVNGLTLTTVPDQNGNIVANPIYQNLNPTNPDNTGTRDPSLVFLAEIIGVPWQDIARTNAQGQPDLIHGIDPTIATTTANPTANQVGGFKSFNELNKPDAQGHAVWDYILGNYETFSQTAPTTGDVVNYGLALDPLMIESVNPRSPGADTGVGTTVPAGATKDQGTGKPIKLLTDATCAGNPMDPSCPPNGHEWLDSAKADLQYACIFTLPTPRHCLTTTSGSCDCPAATNGATPSNSPLCENDPTDPAAGNRTLQVRAKGYPGLKELAILQGVGQQGIVASICPKQLADNTQQDFGYRPAIQAIIERLKKALGGQCLPRTLTPDKATGEVPCLILEATTQVASAGTSVATACSAACSKPGHQAVSAAHQPAAKAAAADPNAPTGNSAWNCFCEVTQLTGADLKVCEETPTDNPVDASGMALNGWCYVDATVSYTDPNIGLAAQALTAKCPVTEQRLIRFVGEASAAGGATLFITCAGGS